MKLTSPPIGFQEGRSRDGHGPSCRSRTDRTALLESSASSSSASCCASFSHCCTGVSGVSGPSTSRERSPELPRTRSTKKRRKTESQEKSKKAKSSKKSKKKKHHKKRRRVSASTFFSPSSRSHSPSTARSPSLPFSETRRPTPQPPTAASAGCGAFTCQTGVLNSRKATGWDVGPDWLEGRRLGGGAQYHGGNAKFSSSENRLAGLQGERRCAASEREEESVQRHDPKTYEKAFGVAIPSGQYSFVSEDTDLTVLMPDTARKPAEQKVRTTAGAAGAVRLSPRSQMSIAATEGADYAGDFVGQLPAAPPALGILRLLKEASKGEKAKQAQKSDNSADGLKEGSARGGPGGNKVTSKTHPHLFWQCWNCSADNYKTRHQCYRCNRLYMQ